MNGPTRVENILINGRFGDGVMAGLRGNDFDKLRLGLARKTWADLRALVCYKRDPAPILTPGASQSKLGKNTVATFGLMLMPERGFMAPSLADVRKAFDLTGGFNLCPMASKGCAAACLSRSGQSGMPQQQRAQAVRTAFLLAHPYHAGILIGNELRLALKREGRINLRLNTTSDIRWELVAPDMVQGLGKAGVMLYDYTAWSPADRGNAYPLTFSAKEPTHTSDEYLADILRSGRNVAVPFTTRKGQALPTTWLGFPVIDGDVSDERRLDPRAVIVGLRAKGHEWKRDNTAGFIRQAN